MNDARRGFTLIEMMIVIAIMGVVVASVVDLYPMFAKSSGREQRALDADRSMLSAVATLRADLDATFAIEGEGVLNNPEPRRRVTLHLRHDDTSESNVVWASLPDALERREGNVYRRWSTLELARSAEWHGSPDGDAWLITLRTRGRASSRVTISRFLAKRGH